MHNLYAMFAKIPDICKKFSYKLVNEKEKSSIVLTVAIS